MPKTEAKSIYVEILMRTPMETLWSHTQTPELHARWDARFSEIIYLPRTSPSEPQQFLYATRIGFGLAIQGKGETVGSREEKSGKRTSALKFWSDSPISLIREGSGYWQYLPEADSVRFLTRYSYRTRFGLIGSVFDSLIFRPLMGWATAWSFDRLRMWLERGIEPAVALERSVISGLVRLTLAFAWIYQGLIPKLLFRDTGELTLLQHTHLAIGYESSVLRLIGIAEILFGVTLFVYWRSKLPLLLNNVSLFLLGLGALLSQPRVMVAPFNPVTLNLSMFALGLLGLIVLHDLPDARNCRRFPLQKVQEENQEQTR